MNFNVSSLLRCNDTELSFEETMDLSGELFHGHALFSQCVKVSCRIENRAGSLKLYADLNTVLSTICARCLKELEIPLSVHVESLMSETIQNADNEDILPIVDARVDPTALFYDMICLNVEPRYYCDEACLGLCPTCGKNLNESTCACIQKEVDPRLAVLKKLLD